MKKIAYCLISDGMGGAENIVLQTLLYLRTNDKFYLIINNEIAKNFKDVLPIERILNIGDIYLHKKYKIIRYLLNNRFYNLRRVLIKKKIFLVNQFLSENEIQVVHSHLDYALYIGLEIKRKYNPTLKIIFTVHSAFGFLEDKTLKPQLSFKHIHFSEVDSFVFVSNYVYEIYKEKVPIKHYQVIYNGIDTRLISPIKREYHTEVTFNILYLGGEKLVKGYDVLIDTIDLLVNENKLLNIKVFVLGSISQNSDLQSLIKSKQLDSKMELVGFTKPNELIKFFDQSHILFMPSRTEAMPLAAIEAVFHNLPIVASAVGGIPELVSSGNNGFCVNLKSELFADKIRFIMQSYTNFIVETEVYNIKLKQIFSLDYMCKCLLKYYVLFDQVSKNEK